VALVAACLLAIFSADSDDKAALKPEKDRQAAPDFTLRDASGHAVRLSDYRGKVVLLNFWATWCPPCQEEIPWFIGFQKQYGGRDFAVLGVSVDKYGWEAVKPYVKRAQVNYRVMLAGEDVTQLYGGVDALPTTFMIDRDGRIASHHIGLASRKVYQEEILDLLGSTQHETTVASPHAGFEALARTTRGVHIDVR
jgi:peroxiredoxin